MKTIAYIIEASVPYEGSWIVAGYKTRESAQRYIDRTKRRIQSFDRKCAKDEDYSIDNRWPEHYREDLTISEITLKP